MSAVEKFPVLLSEAEEESSAVPPCFSHEGINVCPFQDCLNPAPCTQPPRQTADRVFAPSTCIYDTTTSIFSP